MTERLVEGDKRELWSTFLEDLRGFCIVRTRAKTTKVTIKRADLTRISVLEGGVRAGLNKYTERFMVSSDGTDKTEFIVKPVRHKGMDDTKKELS